MAVLHVPTRQAPQNRQCQEPDLLRYLIIRHTTAIAWCPIIKKMTAGQDGFTLGLAGLPALMIRMAP